MSSVDYPMDVASPSAAISSSLMRRPLRCVRHSVVGAPSIRDVTMVIRHMLQHGKVPVLWDAREMDVAGDPRRFEQYVRRLLARSQPAPCREKSAFVVSPSARQRIEGILMRLELPWAWAVFESSDEAVDWLRA